jgi:MFS family permease
MLDFFRPGNSLWKKEPSIYMAAFFMSFYGGIYIVTLPFIITSVGGTDKDLGLCASMGFISYLIGCITLGPRLDRFNSRRLAQIGSGLITISVSSLLAIVLLNTYGYKLPRPVLLVIIPATISGFLTSIYWPPIMGWLSAGREGKDLNRKLGIYNMSWSGALAISPFVGGLLIGWSLAGALCAAMVCVAAAFAAVTLAHPPQIQDDKQNVNNPQPEKATYQLEQFRWISRIALFTVFTCVGLMKTQFAMLLTEEMHLPKSHFGSLTAIMWLFTCMIFFAATKIHSWHYKIVPTIFAQVSVLLSMLIIITCSFANAFYIVAVLIGLGQGFIYISHQFYAASQSTKRSGSMAVHEILLSAGQILGFIAGGYLAAYFDRRFLPYWFGFCVVVVGLVAQMIVLRIFLNNRKKIVAGY